MPIQISLADALDKGFDSLLPSDFLAFVASIESEPADEGLWLVFADWLNEHDEPQLEFSIRWAVARHIRPRKRSTYGGRIEWGWGEWWNADKTICPYSIAPEQFRNAFDKCDSNTLMGVMAKTAKVLVLMQEDLFGITARPIENDDPPEPTPVAAGDPVGVVERT